MPKRQDIESILIIGAGPIVIGQGCEFDYSGAQACQALKEEGYRVILVNSNPATIMTDPNLADSTYIEPIQWEMVARIIEKERPDALLPTMGGQTALNCALDLAREGVLEQYGVALIGASRDAIDKAEDRDKFRQAMDKIGLKMPRSFIAKSLASAKAVQAELGFPTIIRPSFTLGGSGGGIAYNHEEFETICKRGLDLSPTHELSIEESVLGWKEYEMEVVRDKQDNCIIVCAIENLDPMGIHTGDSITVAPAQTLTDKEYQVMRNASIAVLREIGVETGGSNVQFAVNPSNGDMVVIEMNPRVSRSSALASKATGFPIARVAAKLAVGYTLDELSNEMTDRKTPCAFEPTIDYVVTKIPRFNFEKFSMQDGQLTTQMKSVGEVMAIGRCFQESFQKALRGLETNHFGLTPKLDLNAPDVMSLLRQQLTRPGADRIWYVGDAFRLGLSVEDVHQMTFIDPWFLCQIEDLIRTEAQIQTGALNEMGADQLLDVKRKGFSDRRLADLWAVDEAQVRERRHALAVRPVYKRVDTCSAEFAVSTAYLYSTYETFCEAEPSTKEKIMVLGGGPNRIGQGIEFDYCCVHASLAMREAGYETIMVNCNPETVSTDFDISDKLYFEPLTMEDVFEIVAKEQPKGVIVQYGGQTPLKLAKRLEAAGVPILGTAPDAIDQAEDRARFTQVLDTLGLKQPPNGTATTLAEGLAIAENIGYPLVVRPSYVLGGRAMEIVHNETDLKSYLLNAFTASDEPAPVLLDRFLDDAIEVDVDAIADGTSVVIGGMMEHIEQAGVHSGDSACSLPPYRLSEEIQANIRNQVVKLAQALKVKGLLNAQLAVQAGEVFVLEVNPRAARTVPFVSKAIGCSLAKVAALCMIGVSLAEQGFTKERVPDFYSVKKSVFPFVKFPHADPILGPEMRSTSEVMGVGESFAEAFAKGDMATSQRIRPEGEVFISVKDRDKPKVVDIALDLVALGYRIVATRGTANYLLARGVPCTQINKVAEGRPHVVDSIKNDKIVFIVNTTEGRHAIADSFAIRRNAVSHKVSYETTIAGARAVVLAMKHDVKQVFKLQDLHLRVTTQ